MRSAGAGRPVANGSARDEVARIRPRYGIVLALACLALPRCGSEAPPDDATQAPAGDAAVGERATAFDEPLAVPARGNAAAADAVLQQALGMLRARMYEDAATTFDHALELDPSHLPTLLEQGFLLCDPTPAHNPGKAVRAFRLARLVHPDHPAALAGEGIARALAGDAEGARPLLQSTASLDPPLPAMLRGRVELALGKLSLAAREGANAKLHLERAFATAELPPLSRAEAARELGLLELEAGAIDEATRLLHAALDVHREDVATHYHLSRLARRQGDTATADRHAQIHHILRELQDHDSLRFDKDHTRRVELRRQLVEADPDSPRARALLVRELLVVGHTDEALREIDALAAKAGSDRERAEVSFFRARAHARAGDLAGAEERIAELRRLDPALPSALLREVLRDWKRSSEEITEEMCQQTFERWAADGGRP